MRWSLKKYLLLLLQGLRTSWRWTRSRPFWPRSWLRYWHCGRCRRTRHRTTASVVCWNDSDPNFRRGPGSLRPYCGHLPIHEIRSILEDYFPARLILTRKKRKSVIQFFSSKNTDFKTLQKVRPFPVKKKPPRQTKGVLHCLFIGAILSTILLIRKRKKKSKSSPH